MVKIISLYQALSDTLESPQRSRVAIRSQHARFFQGWLLGKISSTTFDLNARRLLSKEDAEVHKKMVLHILRLEGLAPENLSIIKRFGMGILKANRSRNPSDDQICDLEEGCLPLAVIGIGSALKNLLDAVLYRKFVSGPTNDGEHQRSPFVIKINDLEDALNNREGLLKRLPERKKVAAQNGAENQELLFKEPSS